MIKEIILNDQNFTEEVLKSKQPVLVDFWAEWCMPCKMIAPVLQEIAEEFDGKIKVAKINIDKAPLTADKFKVEAIPSLILFKSGEVVEKIVGVQPKEIIVKEINKIL